MTENKTTTSTSTLGIYKDVGITNEYQSYRNSNNSNNIKSSGGNVYRNNTGYSRDRYSKPYDRNSHNNNHNNNNNNNKSNHSSSHENKRECTLKSLPNILKIQNESDPVKLKARQKQIDYGKNTIGYDNYTSQVPKHTRAKEHPKTPDRNQKCSRRSWLGQIKKWRRELHKYDPNGGKDDENFSDQDDDDDDDDERDRKHKKSTSSMNNNDDDKSVNNLEISIESKVIGNSNVEEINQKQQEQEEIEEIEEFDPEENQDLLNLLLQNSSTSSTVSTPPN
ncbi:hypothetical protein CYY_009383 [Polysphondylium violaceum]|uniref:Histone RNA hairpin-binding protein RNA-binding domain-containing protein n=1 Tax=Polysphondylium violaceum TaxID=133409 RepID=A0A8J4V0J5_9MYCE|nr:hypothetical protein CYY_009383 [Polysphondylium violaceum]